MKEKECTCPIFRALEKQGLRWNPETEEIETKRWRAKEFERSDLVPYLEFSAIEKYLIQLTMVSGIQAIISVRKMKLENTSTSSKGCCKKEL